MRLPVRTFPSRAEFEAGEGLRLVPGDAIQLGEWDHVTVRNVVDGAFWNVAAEQREGLREFHVWPLGVKPPWGEHKLRAGDRNSFVGYGVSVAVSTAKEMSGPLSSLISGAISYGTGEAMDDELTWVRVEPDGTVIGFDSSNDRLNVYLAEGAATVMGAGGEPMEVGTGQAVTVTRDSVSRPERFDSSDLSPSLRSALEDARRGEGHGAAGLPIPGAQVTGLRFYEAGSKSPPRGERRYAERFPRAETQFVWFELHLEYPEPGRRIEFPVESVWYGPDGGVLGRKSFGGYVKADWDGSFHWDAWRPRDGEAWKPGPYRVEIFFADRKVASGSFEIDGPHAASAIPIPGAKVTGLRFYEGGFNAPSLDQRRYVTRFSSPQTRYVWFELGLEYPPPGRRIEFPIKAVWYRPDGSVLTRQTLEGVVEADWNNSYHSQAWGAEQAGSWKPGEYRVEVFVEGQKVANGSFEIY
jgi:hypothetical protein